MKYVVIDLEWNGINRKYQNERSIWSSEIIQIGAVALNEAFAEVDHFDVLVKPRFNDQIAGNISKLTGITTAMLENAPGFEAAIASFFEWCHALGDDVRIIQWGESDYLQVAGEMKLKQYQPRKEDEDLLLPWIDLQKEFNEKLGLDRSVSLNQALQYAGVDFEGRPHNALYDARNTAALFEILRTPELQAAALQRVVDALKPKKRGASLGEMFDFSQFVLTA